MKLYNDRSQWWVLATLNFCGC